MTQKDLTLNSAVPEAQFLSCAKYMCLPSCWDYSSFLIQQVMPLLEQWLEFFEAHQTFYLLTCCKKDYPQN